MTLNAQTMQTVQPFDLDKLECFCNTIRAERLEHEKRIAEIDRTLARIQQAGTSPAKSTTRG